MDQVDKLSELRRAFRNVPSPEVTQAGFDHDDRHLRRLARLHPGERAAVADLWQYTQDVRYTEIQRPLLAYLLPFCLEAWRDDLRGTRTEYGGFVEQFYPVLADRHVFDQHLAPELTAAVSKFMRESILDEIDDQRGLAFKDKEARPYRWIGAVTTYGVLLPDINFLWNAWWRLESIGQAVAAAQYVSCLMYPENANPVFAPWTPDRGGGPPCLWRFEGFLYADRWLEVNVTFLKAILKGNTVSDVLSRAVSRLAHHPEYEVAARVLGDLPSCLKILEERCVELPRLLEMIAGNRPISWSA